MKIVSDLISIIIPNYNNSFWLMQCLQSCINQKEDVNIEIIVVDDHSTDNSWEILEGFQAKYPLVVKPFKNPKKGGNQARNFGFSKSSGAFIQWLDSDDVLLPKKLEIQSNFLKQHKDYDIVYSDWQLDSYLDDDLIKTELKKESQSENHLIELLKNNWQPPLSYLLKRSIAEEMDEINAWNPDTKIGQDREYFTMAALRNAKFGYVQGVFSIYNRFNKPSVSKQSDERRMELNLSLFKRFLSELEYNENLSSSEVKACKSIIKTEALAYTYQLRKLTLPFTISFEELHLNDLSVKRKLAFVMLWLRGIVMYKFR